jgi:drug/metabolite transporter (DMT)-like permease
MNYTTMILALAFAVIFLTAVFLFMRNYPSDRWVSVVFVVAGGVMAWCAWGTEAGAGAGIGAEVDTGNGEGGGCGR